MAPPICAGVVIPRAHSFLPSDKLFTVLVLVENRIFLGSPSDVPLVILKLPSSFTNMVAMVLSSGPKSLQWRGQTWASKQGLEDLPAGQTHWLFASPLPNLATATGGGGGSGSAAGGGGARLATLQQQGAGSSMSSTTIFGAQRGSGGPENDTFLKSCIAGIARTQPSCHGAPPF